MIRLRHGCGLLAFCGLAVAAGCALPISTASFSEERDIFESRGVRLEKEFSLGVGHSLMALAFNNADEKEIKELAKQIKRVEVAAFKIGTGLRPGRREFAALEARAGWQPVLRSRQGLNQVTVMIQCEGDRISGLLIAALEDEELVLTRLTGNLDQAIAWAMQAGHSDPAPGGTLVFSSHHSTRHSDREE